MKKRVFVAIALAVLIVFALTACGTSQATSDIKKISIDDATSAALNTVGITLKDAEDLEAVLKEDKAAPYYEIHFSSGNQNYDFEINAVTGDVAVFQASYDDDNNDAGKAAARALPEQPADDDTISAEESVPQARTALAPSSEKETGKANDQGKAEIGIEKAKQIALDHAGLKDAVFTEAERDHVDGVLVYEIEFYANGIEYDYEIDAYSGNIRESSADRDDDDDDRKSNTSENKSTSSSISLSKAKSIALDHAGVSSSDAVFSHAKEDYDDGIKIYDIEFYANGAEYEYEINAANGKILDVSVDKDDDHITESKEAASSEISLKKAKSIALNHAGVSSSDAKFEKAETDHDDGVKYYELKFYAGGYEYEYEINAQTGKIIDHEKDKD